MIKFIQENLKLIIEIALMVILIILSVISLVKKSGGKISVWDAVKAVILEKIPSFIAIVESDGKGEEKKNKVLNLVLKEAEESLGRPLSQEEFNAIVVLASKQIELVLAAPQKKEIVPSGPVKSKYRV